MNTQTLEELERLIARTPPEPKRMSLLVGDKTATDAMEILWEHATYFIGAARWAKSAKEILSQAHEIIRLPHHGSGITHQWAKADKLLTDVLSKAPKGLDDHAE